MYMHAFACELRDCVCLARVCVCVVFNRLRSISDFQFPSMSDARESCHRSRALAHSPSYSLTLISSQERAAQLRYVL